MSRIEIRKKRKLSRRLVIAVVTSIVVVTFVSLTAVGILNWFTDGDFYNTKTMQIVKSVSGMVDGDFLSVLSDAVKTPEYRDMYEQAIENEDRDAIKEWLKMRSLDKEFEKCVNQVRTIHDNMDVKFLYIQVIEGSNCTTLIDCEEPYLSLGYEESLIGGKFENIKGNVEVTPRFSNSEFGLLSSGGAPIHNSLGAPVAIAFCDIDVSFMIRNTLWFVYINGAITLVAAFLISLLVSMKIRKNITRPLEQLTDAADSFGTKETGFKKENIAELAIHTQDEIEELYHATHYMQESIIDYMDNLTIVTAEKERIGAELDVATRIQASMLPNIYPAFPERNEFDIYASMVPAKEVGGDFYDYFLIDEDHLGLVVADVSGKGIPAALFMMMSKIILSNYAQMGLPPAEVLAKTNDSICASNEEEMFVTVWFGVLTISTGHIVAGNAGHEYPMIRKADGTFEVFEDKHDFVIGGMEGMPYSQYEFDLEKGGTLFLYTDGCPEATDNNNELFGTDRMIEALNRKPDATPKELLENMRAAVDEFVGTAPQFDDLTMLAISLAPNGKERKED